MSAPIYLVCEEANVPDVSSINAALRGMNYETQIQHDRLWGDMIYGKTRVSRAGRESDVYLLKSPLEIKVDHLNSMCANLPDHQIGEQEIAELRQTCGGIVIETCYSTWNGDTVADAEIHYAVAYASKGCLWRSFGKRNALTHAETLTELGVRLGYQYSRASHEGYAR
ncbi:hypothetical protein K3181_07555 [Qipengyuania sp. YG27]|uniref:Uncharacterized protein n=1 Tax=Qipengyuania mesophila TaxID=2867246 RepID=A0ABS7JUN2_9SPHN|nr:hypothetical protein [Qipengyuania mesophila]MBX7501294.1 hypothetical protein [Qipengyuania mesophila]